MIVTLPPPTTGRQCAVALLAMGVSARSVAMRLACLP